MSEYWIICAETAADEAGLTNITTEQIKAIAEVMEQGHENYAEQHGHVEASRSLWAQQDENISSLKDQLRREQEKIPCSHCAGKLVPGLGGTTEPARYSCEWCNRTGKNDP